MELATRWPLTSGHDVRDALLAAYGDPGRRYHDLTHLSEVLDWIDRLAAAGSPELSPGQLQACRLAAWFHDGVYDGSGEDEERSARWAEDALAPLLEAEEVAEVARLVRLTREHRTDADDLVGQLLCDADLAILAAGPERYAEYVAAVRAEYAHVPDEDFRRGRAAILADLAAQAPLYRTTLARDLLEERARQNLATELQQLTS